MPVHTLNSDESVLVACASLLRGTDGLAGHVGVSVARAQTHVVWR